MGDAVWPGVGTALAGAVWTIYCVSRFGYHVAKGSIICALGHRSLRLQPWDLRGPAAVVFLALGRRGPAAAAIAGARR